MKDQNNQFRRNRKYTERKKNFNNNPSIISLERSMRNENIASGNNRMQQKGNNRRVLGN